MIGLELNENEQHGDMNSASRLAALNKFRNSSSSVILRQTATKVLVIYDIQLKSNEVPHVPLVINYGNYSRKDRGPDAHVLPHRSSESCRRIFSSVCHLHDVISSAFLTRFAFLSACPPQSLQTIRALVLWLILLLQQAEMLKCYDL